MWAAAGGAVAQIFLSYSRKDSDAAKALATALNDNRHKVWWDKKIGGGSKFAAEIEQALDAAEVVIVLWSKDSIASPWVLDEAAEARDTNRLLPLALDDCKPPLGFRQIQTIPAARGVEAALGDLLDSIARMTGELAPSASSRDAARGTALHCARARALAERGEFDAASREIATALEPDPDCAEANREAGWLHYVRGRPLEAIPYYERAAAAAKSDHESPAMLASCYRAAGDEDSLSRVAALALMRAEQTVAAAASTGAAFASGAKALAALGHQERARKWLRKALNLDPGNLPMRYRLAATLARFLDDADTAIDVLEPFAEAASKPIDLQLLEGDPDWQPIRETAAFRSLLAQVRKRVEALESTSADGA
jgi:tetratricopeptide (TPR) repeat protein